MYLEKYHGLEQKYSYQSTHNLQRCHIMVYFYKNGVSSLYHLLSAVLIIVKYK